MSLILYLTPTTTRPLKPGILFLNKHVSNAKAAGQSHRASVRQRVTKGDSEPLKLLGHRGFQKRTPALHPWL